MYHVSQCVFVFVFIVCYVYLSSIDMCDCVHAFIYIAIYAIVHCFVLCDMCMRERLLSLQYIQGSLWQGADTTR